MYIVIAVLVGWVAAAMLRQTSGLAIFCYEVADPQGRARRIAGACLNARVAHRHVETPFLIARLVGGTGVLIAAFARALAVDAGLRAGATEVGAEVDYLLAPSFVVADPTTVSTVES